MNVGWMENPRQRKEIDALQQAAETLRTYGSQRQAAHANGQARQVSDAQFTLAEVFDRMAAARSRNDLPTGVQLPALHLAQQIHDHPKIIEDLES